MKRQRNTFQMKEQDKIQEELNETDINNLSDKEFKVMVIKRLTEIRRRMDKYNKDFNKDRKLKKKNHWS